MRLRKGMLGALLGVTFATTLLATNSVHAETSYTGSVETNQSTENKVGWQKIGNYWYYFDEPGKKHIGWLKLHNNWYYYVNGEAVTGWKFINNNWYYFDVYGQMATGLVSPVLMHGGGWYLLDSSGAMKTGWQKYNGEWCYFGSSGNMYMGWQKIDGKWYYFGPSKNMPELWTVNDKGVWYKYNISGAMKTGWQKIDGAWYYFDSSGAMKTGWLDEGGKKYYLQSSGAMVTNTTVDGYKIDASGVATKVIQNGWQSVNNHWYYYTNGKKVTGWKMVNNVWYYFDSSGVMKTGWQKVNGVWYYFNPSGAMQKGWQKINGAWYYFGTSGAMKTGWLDYAGQKYYLKSTGAMATNTTVDGYKIDASGVATKVIQNRWQSVNNHWYYYTNGKKVTGWKMVNNVWYYFDSSGVMKTGWQKVNGVWYYFNPSGAMQKGWQKVNGVWYYFNPSGAMQKGWQKINGAWYYFGTSGAMKTGWLDEGGKKYYLQSSGAMATNTTVDGYKIDASGVATKVIQNGWQSTENNWYYYTNGKKVTGWKAVNNVWYYFDGSGVMKTGWQKINGVWYYFNPSGAMQKGWQKIDGAWYYFASSGAMKTGWLDYAGQKYYLQSSGAMATNTTVDGYNIDAAGIATKVINPSEESLSWDTQPTQPTEDPFGESNVRPLGDNRFREEIVTLPRQQRTVYDKSMPKGETKLVPGHDGQKRVAYIDAYFNGELYSSVVTEEEVLVPREDDVLYVGCRMTDSELAIIDLKVGDTIFGRTVTRFIGDTDDFVNRTYFDLLQESEDDRFRKANEDIDASYVVTEMEDGVPFDTPMWLGVSDEGVFAFNSRQLADIHKINEMLVAYINADRERAGLNPMEYDRQLLEVASVRSREMAEYGHIRYKGKAHTRPDGSSWSTALDVLPEDYHAMSYAENMQAYAISSNPYHLVSEQYIAYDLFEGWKSSPLHYASMMHPDLRKTAVDCQLTTREGTQYKNQPNWLIATEIFSSAE